MKWFAGADHAGWRLKNQLVEQLRALGDEVEDLGTQGDESVDYPAFGISRFSGTVGHEPFVLPAEEAIRMRLMTRDVIHELWVPELKFKHDLIPAYWIAAVPLLAAALGVEQSPGLFLGELEAVAILNGKRARSPFLVRSAGSPELSSESMWHLEQY